MFCYSNCFATPNNASFCLLMGSIIPVFGPCWKDKLFQIQHRIQLGLDCEKAVGSVSGSLCVLTHAFFPATCTNRCVIHVMLNKPQTNHLLLHHYFIMDLFIFSWDYVYNYK